MGVAAAAESLGIDPRSIAKRSAQAGDRPELDGNAEAWQRAFDLAHAKVEAFLASGKASAATAATTSRRTPLGPRRTTQRRAKVDGRARDRAKLGTSWIASTVAVTASSDKFRCAIPMIVIETLGDEHLTEGHRER